MNDDNFTEIKGENYFGTYKTTRYACRGIVIKDGKILLSYLVKKDFWMLPGGGREDGESDEKCVTRELSEETGYIVTPEKQLTKVVEYYGDIRYSSLYYICKIVGKTTLQLTEGEKEEGLEPRWIPFEEALSIFSENEKYKNIFEEKRGAYLREYSALLKIIKNSYI